MNKCREEFEKEAVRRSMSVVSPGFDGYPYQAGNTELAWQFWETAWNARQPEVVGLNGCGYDKCPKCGGGLATFRHPGAKVNCANCGLVLQEEGGRKVYQPTPASSVPVPTVLEILDYIHDVQAGRTTAIESAQDIYDFIMTKSRGAVNG